jgi:HSP20 family molecular chaperone IbpA
MLMFNYTTRDLYDLFPHNYNLNDDFTYKDTSHDNVTYKRKNVTQYLNEFVVNNDDGSVTHEYDLPGVNKSDVKLTVNDRLLLVSYKRRKVDYKFTLQLSKCVDLNKITSKLENGVLSIRFVNKENVSSNVREIVVR